MGVKQFEMRRDEVRLLVNHEKFLFNLHNYIQRTTLDEEQLKWILLGIQRGLQELYSRKLTHGNINMRNILVSLHDERVLLTDYGLQ